MDLLDLARFGPFSFISLESSKIENLVSFRGGVGGGGPKVAVRKAGTFGAFLPGNPLFIVAMRRKAETNT